MFHTLLHTHVQAPVDPGDIAWYLLDGVGLSNHFFVILMNEDIFLCNDSQLGEFLCHDVIMNIDRVLFTLSLGEINDNELNTMAYFYWRDQPNFS